MLHDFFIKEQLKSCVSGAVLFDEPLDRYTSMGVGGPADALVVPQSMEELVQLVRFLRKENIPFLTLGNGTNLIVRDGGCRGVVVALRGLQKLSWASDPEGKIRVQAEAGVPLASIVQLCIKESLAGLEF